MKATWVVVMGVVIAGWLTKGVEAMEGAASSESLSSTGGAVMGVAAAMAVWRRMGMKGMTRQKKIKVTAAEGASGTATENETDSTEEEGDAVASEVGQQGAHMIRDQRLHKDKEWAGDNVVGSKRAGDLVFAFLNVMRIKEGSEAVRQ